MSSCKGSRTGGVQVSRARKASVTQKGSGRFPGAIIWRRPTRRASPMSVPPNELSAAEAAQRIARCELISERLVAACFERIEAREREVQAWAFVDRGLALSQARRLDGESPRGPLHGIPVGIKDVFDTADMPTEY